MGQTQKFLYLSLFLISSIHQTVQGEYGQLRELSNRVRREAAVDIYEGCGSTKSCFGMPEGCIGSQDCKALATATLADAIFQFEITSSYESQAYIAFGFSNDNKMGDDSVVSCIIQDSKIVIESSWTTRSPFADTRKDVPQNLTKLIDSSYKDGTISCKFSHTSQFTVKGNEFDLNKNAYFLLMASGKAVNDDSVGFHNLGKGIAGDAILLSDYELVAVASKLWLRTHGVLMILAWIGTAPIGIIFARYFKQSFKNSKLCGTAQWFAWHRFLMISTCALTSIGLIIIFIELNGWSDTENPHSIIGITTVALCCLQFLGAFFRPAPDAKSRPYFNWFHFLSGNGSHILALTTIIYGVQLTKSELPDFVVEVVIAFIGIYIAIHAIFTLTELASLGKKTPQEPCPKDNEPNVNVLENKKDLIRKIILVVSVVTVLAFVITLAVLVAKAPL